MTVITTVINKYCTVHASDSLITIGAKKGPWEVDEQRIQTTKLVSVQYWRGAMSYWGAASIPKRSTSTLAWLEEATKEAHKFDSAEEFALDLASRLSLLFRSPIQSYPLGIHFTVYKDTRGHQIPELFQITNFSTKHKTFFDQFRVTRETYNNAFKKLTGKDKTGPLLEHREPEHGQYVDSYLKAGGWFIYNNGDPELFNPIADAVIKSFKTLSERRLLKASSDVCVYEAIARLSIELVADMQTKFTARGYRRVGGKIHSLVIRPDGTHEPNCRS